MSLFWQDHSFNPVDSLTTSPAIPRTTLSWHSFVPPLQSLSDHTQSAAGSIFSVSYPLFPSPSHALDNSGLTPTINFLFQIKFHSKQKFLSLLPHLLPPSNLIYLKQERTTKFFLGNETDRPSNIIAFSPAPLSLGICMGLCFAHG